MALLDFPERSGETRPRLRSMPRYVQWGVWTAYAIFLLLLCEIVAQFVVLRFTGVLPLTDKGGPNSGIFQPHPYLVGVPRPGAVVRRGQLAATIDSLGFRGRHFSPPRSDSTLRVLAIGGSTTFGVGIDDRDTWPWQLETVLDSALAHAGSQYHDAEVINFGVPGYTTVESLIQFVLHGVHLKPDVVVLFHGLNDARNGHSPGLRTDYSNFHGIEQRENLELTRLQRGNRVGLIRVGREIVERIFLEEPRLPPGERRPGPDPQAQEIFKSNLKSFAAICRGYGIACVFVPQTISSDFPVNEWWFRYLEPTSLAATLAQYNADMRTVASVTGIPFVESVTRTNWTAADFVDYCHFSRAGNRKFAHVLLPYITELVSEVSPGKS